MTLPIPKALDYAVQIAGALAAAHAQGIVHRDIKPANIVITHDGRVKLLDFGVAKLVERPPDAVTRTALATGVGVIMGTAAYMSPEQAEGRPVGGRSDIFSLGAVLYEMIAGRRPFESDTEIGTITAILRDAPPSLRMARPEAARGDRDREAMPRQDPARAVRGCAHAARRAHVRAAAGDTAPTPQGGGAQSCRAAALREVTVQRAKDVFRAVDYLASRPDIDGERLAYYSLSMGAYFGPIPVSLEPRITVAVFASGGLRYGYPPEAQPANFAPQVRVPVLLVNGKKTTSRRHRPTSAGSSSSSGRRASTSGKSRWTAAMYRPTCAG